jgi:hypothetical protein
MCVCAEDRRDEERRLCRAVAYALIAAAGCGGGVALLQWSTQAQLHRFPAPTLLFSGQVAVATFWSALLFLYFLMVRRSPARLAAERRARRVQALLDARVTLARGCRRRR